MGIKLLDDGRTEIKHYYRLPDGTATHVKKTINTQLQKEIFKAKAELIERVERCSLKDACCKWEELVDAVVRKNDGAGMPWVYNQVKEGLKGYVDDSFVKRYNRYLDKLEIDGKSTNTISNHKSAIRRTLNYAYETGRIDQIPIRKFDIEQKFRDRVWNTTEERLRFFNTLQKEESHLLHAVTLLELRPIRAASDLFRLTDENLVYINGLPVLRYYAKKTERSTKSEGKLTHIPLYTKSGEVFSEIVDYIHHGRPKDCHLLYPRITGNTWEQMGDPKKHWKTMCRKADIKDFHIHDLKHIATTNMIEEGWSIEQLLGMGCQFSEKMIKKVYWKQNAEKALAPDVLSDKQNNDQQFANF